MTIKVRIEKSDANRVEFDAGDSEMSQVDALKIIIELAQNTLKTLGEQVDG